MRRGFDSAAPGNKTEEEDAHGMGRSVATARRGDSKVAGGSHALLGAQEEGGGGGGLGTTTDAAAIRLVVLKPPLHSTPIRETTLH
jgi:hypothetical protein